MSVVGIKRTKFGLFRPADGIPNRGLRYQFSDFFLQRIERSVALYNHSGDRLQSLIYEL